MDNCVIKNYFPPKIETNNVIASHSCAWVCLPLLLGCTCTQSYNLYRVLLNIYILIIELYWHISTQLEGTGLD